MKVSAKVVWSGQDTTVGLSWRSRDTGGTRRIKELVRRMEEWNATRETHDVGGPTLCV
jgi:hypothetical protein